MVETKMLSRAHEAAAGCGAAEVPRDPTVRGAWSGIIDIGSNSIRFVAYGGDRRVPAVLFNEKVMAGLGKGLNESGELAADAMARALVALRRFRLLSRNLGLADVQTVATAAVRDARNGPAFMAQIAALGFEPTLIPGPEEARLAGLGVLSAIPDADGIAADLGGGSLELIRVAGGAAGEGLSLPLGVLRLTPEQSQVPALRGQIVRAMAGTGLARAAAGRPLYLVGGSWRALGLIDLHLSGHPLPIVHQHRLTPARVVELRGLMAAADRQTLRAVPSLSGSRIPTLPAAAALLDALSQTLEPSELVVCAYGLREGLLFRGLSASEQRIDPLLAAAREVGGRYGRFDDHGDLIERWIASTFADDSPPMRRLRLAACLLADIAWGAHPDFRAERAVDMAVHGNWVGIDAAGRAMLGLALFSVFGGTRGFDERIAGLCSPEQCTRAQGWGLAIRLAQRLSGGVAAPLEASTLRREDGLLTLSLPGEVAALYGEAVSRRHKQLATALGTQPRIA
ncbi:MAG TPA: Ppx/GppA family phosphatase [Sphingomonadaceae bacterium]|nr:Ppx/GppA family phosphatase [Sphingomonadaceae bacterium]